MQITFAVDHKTEDGREYSADSTHEVDDNEARNYVSWGVARRASAEQPAEAEATAPGEQGEGV